MQRNRPLRMNRVAATATLGGWARRGRANKSPAAKCHEFQLNGRRARRARQAGARFWLAVVAGGGRAAELRARLREPRTQPGRQCENPFSSSECLRAISSPALRPARGPLSWARGARTLGRHSNSSLVRRRAGGETRAGRDSRKLEAALAGRLEVWKCALAQTHKFNGARWKPGVQLAGRAGEGGKPAARASRANRPPGRPLARCGQGRPRSK